MIDFMVNIKNKKNMTMGNMKTLMATSLLYVFFNGILIYGVEKNQKFNFTENEHKDHEIPLYDNNNTNIEYNNFIPNKIEEDEGAKDKPIKIKKTKKTSDNIFFNYKGNFSLLFCFNLCNNKEDNKHMLRIKKQLKKEKVDKEKLLEILMNEKFLKNMEMNNYQNNKQLFYQHSLNNEKHYNNTGNNAYNENNKHKTV